MTIFPKVAGIFASAFTPLSSAYAKKAAESGKGRSWYIAINDAVAYGETATLTTGIILMPIILVIAFTFRVTNSFRWLTFAQFRT